MIARGRHGFRHVLEQRFAVMLDTAGFAVHQLMRTDNLAAERRAQGLMSQAHAQHRTLAGEMLDQINADARLLRRAGSGRNQNMAGAPFPNVFRGGLVIAAHLYLLSQLAQILDQVVSEGIVVVQDEDHAGAFIILWLRKEVFSFGNWPYVCDCIAAAISHGASALSQVLSAKYQVLLSCFTSPMVTRSPAPSGKSGFREYILRGRMSCMMAQCLRPAA